MYGLYSTVKIKSKRDHNKRSPAQSSLKRFLTSSTTRSRLLVIACVTLLQFYFFFSIYIAEKFHTSWPKLDEGMIGEQLNLFHNLKSSTSVENGDIVKIREKGPSHDAKGTKKIEEIDNDQLENSKATEIDKKRIKKIQNRSNAAKPVLTAYIESTDQKDWEIKPLPTRKTQSTDLNIKEFPEVSSCTNLPEQWPIDEKVAPTNIDPFLPWIHDVFPTADGRFIQFVAQNKRRCQSGKRKMDIKIFMQPNVALFQHIPIKRIEYDDELLNRIGAYNSTSERQQRYRLSTHEEADEDGIETRFICRFKPSMEETLSVFNFNYDYNTFRKVYSSTFTYEGLDNHIIWNSQLLFQCPVPETLQETIRKGTSVYNDYATLFVDLIPIRTPPRYIPPHHFLPPRFERKNEWNGTEHYGSKHLLPLIEDSGRWENIPICKPSLMTYPDEYVNGNATLKEENDHKMAEMAETKVKKNKLIACTWTSAGFHTRGGRTFVTDGSQRLLQWLVFNKLVGVDHVYIYDNSGATSKSENLKSVTDLFPGYVTRINWPCKVCNNNPGNLDNKGERSSQYAAESSCRLRFGAHSEWLASFDTDEYPTPLDSYNDLKDLLDDMDKEDIRIVNFASKRSKPRIRFFNTTSPGSCNKCFDPILPKNTTFLQAYNCNIERPPRKDLMPAEKQIYKTDYILLHFVHYSAITVVSAMTEKEERESEKKYRRRYRDHHTRYVNETTEATMLHTKSITARETFNWFNILQSTDPWGKVGAEFPSNKGLDDGKVEVIIKGDPYVANCFPVEKIDNYWVPKLSMALADLSSKAV